MSDVHPAEAAGRTPTDLVTMHVVLEGMERVMAIRIVADMLYYAKRGDTMEGMSPGYVCVRPPDVRSPNDPIDRLRAARSPAPSGPAGDVQTRYEWRFTRPDGSVLRYGEQYRSIADADEAKAKAGHLDGYELYVITTRVTTNRVGAPAPSDEPMRNYTAWLIERNENGYAEWLVSLIERPLRWTREATEAVLLEEKEDAHREISRLKRDYLVGPFVDATEHAFIVTSPELRGGT
jgi:hypothetical protein